MQNTLIGFTHDQGFRVFSFDRLGADRVATRCTVRADLVLTRAYGIQVQELPLLCLGLLDRCEEGNKIQSLTFDESEMRVCAEERASIRKLAAARTRKPWRRPAGERPRNFGIDSDPTAVRSATAFNTTFSSTKFPSTGGSQL